MTPAVPAGIVLGWAADRALGDPVRRHPVAGLGAGAQRLERHLWRDHRAAGVGHALAVVGTTATLVAVLERRVVGYPVVHAVVTGAVVWTCLGGRSLRRAAVRVADDLDAGDLTRARDGLVHLCGRDPQGLDADGLARAATESVAENTGDAVVATLLAAAVAGPTGAALHRAADVLDGMVGYRGDRYARFGWAAARLDDLLAWVPARVTAWTAVALAATVDGRPRDAARILWRDGRRHPSPNGGPTEAAWAGALCRRLGGGDNDYGGHVEARPPQGDGPAPSSVDVRRAVALAARVEVATLLLALLLAGLRARRRARSTT